MRRSVVVGSSLLLVASALVAPGVSAVAAPSKHKPAVTGLDSNRGATAGYAHVIIKGSGFSATPTVTFGSVPATDVHVRSSHTLVVYAPGHRHGLVHVRVRTSAGTSPRSDSNIYTYVHQVTPGTWHAQTAPVPAGAPADDFVAESTSCPATTACYSAGLYGPADENAPEIGPLISTRVSGVVSTQQAPVPDGVNPAKAELGPISCPTVGNCVAIGLYDRQHIFAEVLANGTWTPSKVDPKEDGDLNRLGGLSCAAAGECVAVASRTDESDNSSGPVVLRLHKGVWTTSAVVPPAKGGTELDSVDCASASYCLASGYFGQGTQAAGAFVVQVADGKQTVRAIPDAPHQGQPTSADAVQCPAVGRCTVLTAFADSDSGGKDASDFVTVKNGRSFTFRAITLPADADSLSLFAYGNGNAHMSCPAVSVCFAESVYESRGLYIAAVARLDHGKVFFYNLPRPEHPRNYVGVDDIDCATTTACTAVGSAALSGKTDPDQAVGAYFTFADGVWTTQVAAKAPGQHGGATSTNYSSVECPAAGACTANGDYLWNPQPNSDDGSTVYLYDNDSGLVSIESPN